MGAHRQLEIVSSHSPHPAAATARCQTIQHFATHLPESLAAFCAGQCGRDKWAVVQLWTPNDEGDLRCAQSWFADEGFRDFCCLSELCTLAPGIDLPGEALNVGVPAWSNEMAENRQLPRAPVAAQAGLNSGLAIPVFDDGAAIAVIEFLSRERQALDDRSVEFPSALAQRALDSGLLPAGRKSA